MLRLTILASVSALTIMGCANTNRQTAETNAAASTPIVSNNHVTLTNLNMNNQGDHITIKPGKTVEATLSYAYHCPNCYKSLNNQIIIGLAKRSAQACVYDGGAQGQGTANVTLKVPAKPGQYDVRFRGLQASDCNAALKAGWNADTSPSSETTIGTITVSRKAVE
jgi:hypothetical protein